MVEAAANSIALRTGRSMPKLGLGLWKVPKDVCAETVYNAIANGYRLLDGACDYGNEVEVGQGIKKAIDEGLVTRADLFITTKLWNTFHRPEHVKPACQRSMTDLGIDYIDLYLIHFPIHLKYVPFEEKYPPEWKNPAADKLILDTGVTYQQTYQAMEQLVEEGLVRDIGVSNVATSLLQEIMNFSTIKPAVLQVELHPYLSQQNLLKFCRINDIAVTAYSSFGGASWIELGASTQEETPMMDAVISEIAARHSKTAA